MFELKMFFILLLFIQIKTIENNLGVIDPKAYLQNYGYLGVNQRTEGSISDALKTFQAFNRIPTSGVFDDKTRQRMSISRCGNKDPVQQFKNMTRNIPFYGYILAGSKWTNYKLTYKIVGYSTKLDHNKTLATIKEAFELWSSITPLRFIHVTDLKRTVHFDIKFATTYHCCHPYGIPETSKFDGKGGDLAHASFPENGGDIHFDDDDDFTFGQGSFDVPSFLYVSTHEIGHALGLEHTWDSSSVMYPSNVGPFNKKLDISSIKGIQVLYGDETIVLP